MLQTPKRRRYPVAKVKGGWTQHEDDALRRLVHELPEGQWSAIARALNAQFGKTSEDGRIGKQCRERWNHHLRPDIKKEAWTEEEERTLVTAHQAYGNRWSDIARTMSGRTENAVKNHWNATLRRKEERGERGAGSGATSKVLRDYMRSHNMLREPRCSQHRHPGAGSRAMPDSVQPPEEVGATLTAAPAVYSSPQAATPPCHHTTPTRLESPVWSPPRPVAPPPTAQCHDSGGLATPAPFRPVVFYGRPISSGAAGPLDMGTSGTVALATAAPVPEVRGIPLFKLFNMKDGALAKCIGGWQPALKAQQHIRTAFRPPSARHKGGGGTVGRADAILAKRDSNSDQTRLSGGGVEGSEEEEADDVQAAEQLLALKAATSAPLQLGGGTPSGRC